MAAHCIQATEKLLGKEHVGKPLLIAIHDFHQKDSMMWSRKALESYLFGAKHIHLPENDYFSNVELIEEHRWNEKFMPSNFSLNQTLKISVQYYIQIKQRLVNF